MPSWAWSRNGWPDESRHRHDFPAHPGADAGAPARAGHSGPEGAGGDEYGAAASVRRRRDAAPCLRRHPAADRPGPDHFQPVYRRSLCELACQGRSLDRVLEIGGGCGYQAAVLAKLAREVLSIERIAKLVGHARVTLRGLRVNNVLMKNADGGTATGKRRRSMPSSSPPRCPTSRMS